MDDSTKNGVNAEPQSENSGVENDFRPLSEEELDSLTPEQLEEIELDDEGNPIISAAAQVAAPKPDEEAVEVEKSGEKDVKEPSKEEESSKGQKDSEADEGKDEEGDGEDEKTLSEKEILEKRVRDNQRMAREKAEEAARLRKQNQELQMKLEQKLVADFEELDEETLEILKEEDPDSYNGYLKEKEEHDKKVAEIQEKQAEQIQTIQLNEIFDFVKSVTGFDFDAESKKDIEKATAEIQKIMSDEEGEVYKTLIHAEKTRKPDQFGVIDVSGLLAAHDELFRDKIIEEREKEAREKLLNNINNLGDSGSPFDKSERQERRSPTPKSIEEMTQEEIEALGEDEVNQLLQYYDPQE